MSVVFSAASEKWPSGSKAHAWKVCIRQRIEGSNPSFSAIQTKDAPLGRFLFGALNSGKRTLGFDKLCSGQSLDAEP